MIALEITLLWAAMVLYLGNAVLAWVALLWERERWLRWCMALLLLGLAVHAFPIVERWIRVGHGPYINALEVLSSSVWVGLATFAVVAARREALRWAAAPVLTLCVLLMGWAVMSSAEVQPLPPTFKGVWLIVHIVAAKLAFGAILAGAGLGVVYLVRSRALPATGTPESVALAGLDRLSHRLVAFGFVFIAFMTAAGSIWARNAWGSYWSWDPLETWSLVTWIAYGLALHLRLTFGLRGRGWAGTVIGLCAVTVFALFIAVLVSPTVHTEFMVS